MIEIPNWCENELTVAGSEDELEAFFQKAQEGNKRGEARMFSFNPFVPYPKHYAELDKLAEDWDKAHPYVNGKAPKDWKKRPKDGYNQGGYDWCCNHWGTKWEADLHSWLSKKRSLWYFFLTAWSPPREVVLEMSRQFPNLLFTLKFWECGVGFRGTYKVKGGVVLKYECKEYAPTRNPRGG